MSVFKHRKALTCAALLITLSVAASQQQSVLMVAGYQGQAPVLQVNGRAFVDVEALARITNSSLRFDNDRIVLALPSSPVTVTGSDSPSHSAGLSRPFMAAAVETIASLREWGSTLVVAIQNGYPVGNAMSVYRGRAMDQLRLASAAVSTDSDRSALALLTTEFNNVQAWSNKLVNARNSMQAADFAMSDDALKTDPMFQGIVRCGQFLGQMVASGAFQDDGSCR